MEPRLKWKWNWQNGYTAAPSGLPTWKESRPN